jgi:phage baseplate assembly protein W
MFPFDLDDDEDIVAEEETKSEPTDYEIDFATGELTGRIITGLPAIVQWIRLTLGTERYFYNQFSWNYGSELETLIGQGFNEEVITSEVQRMVADALSTNDDIDGISSLEVAMNEDSLNIDFTVETAYGSEEVNINV